MENHAIDFRGEYLSNKHSYVKLDKALYLSHLKKNTTGKTNYVIEANAVHTDVCQLSTQPAFCTERIPQLLSSDPRSPAY